VTDETQHSCTPTEKQTRWEEVKFLGGDSIFIVLSLAQLIFKEPQDGTQHVSQ
jgi:hypothetical protein